MCREKWNWSSLFRLKAASRIAQVLGLLIAGCRLDPAVCYIYGWFSGIHDIEAFKIVQWRHDSIDNDAMRCMAFRLQTCTVHRKHQLSRLESLSIDDYSLWCIRFNRLECKEKRRWLPNGCRRVGACLVQLDVRDTKVCQRPGSNRRPSACKADVMTTTLRRLD